jgi:hypothetical protein
MLRPVLVGRERHVRQLEREITSLRDRRTGGLLLIVGEAGVGKTRLTDEVIALATGAGARAHRVTCWAEAGAPPFWPWSELLRALGAEPLVVTSDVVDRDLARFQLFSTVADQLRDCATRDACVLMIDDVHWADAPSLALLAFVAPLLRDIGVLLVATYRSDEIDAAGEFPSALQHLVRHGRQLALAPFQRDELATFVEDLAGRSVSGELVDRLYALTAGNALYTRETVTLLESDSLLERTATTDLPIPDTVRTALDRRLAEVSSDCHDLLAVASVIGVAFPLDVLQESMPCEPELAWALIDEAQEHRLVREAGAGRFAFSHPLLREHAYRDLGLARRVRLHENIARALEARRDAGLVVDAAELAFHFDKAAAGGNATKAVEYGIAAGHESMSLLAYEAAVVQFDHALETLALCPDDPPRRASLLVDLGEAIVAAGDLPRAREVFYDAATLARAEKLPVVLGRAALGRGSGRGGFEVASFDAAQIELLRSAIDALGETEPELRSWLLARLSVALSLEGSEDERRALADEAIELARSIGENRTLAYALAAHCDTIAGPDFCEQRLRESTEILPLARTCGDVRGELLGRRLRVLALAELARFEEMDQEVDAYEQLATTIRQPLYEWYVPLWRAMRALMVARFDDADRLADLAEQIGSVAHSDNAKMLVGTLRLGAMYFRGDYAGMFALGSEFMTRWPELTHMMYPGLSMTRARLDDIDTAKKLLAELELADIATWGAEWLPSIAMIAETCAIVGDTSLAPQVYDALEPYRHLQVIDGIGAANYGSVERYLGMLAAALHDDDRARAHFAAAREVHERLGTPALVEVVARDAARFASAASTPAEPVATRTGAMQREGDVWAVTYEGRTARLRHTKGLGDIACLLAQPGSEVHALDLVDAGPTLAQRDTGPQLDAAARDAYKRRLAELEHELAEADTAADIGRSERLAHERDALLRELSSAYGVGGRARRPGDAGERARSAVTQRVRDALARIQSEHPPLGEHLHRSIRTGTFCAYEPDGPVVWTVVSHS